MTQPEGKSSRTTSRKGNPSLLPVESQVPFDPALEETLEALEIDDITAQRIKKLPHDVGWLLITAGILGVIIPGVLGAPFLALGGLMLWPKSSHRAERWLAGHSPRPLKGSMRQINRFLDDLERRYPSRKP